MPFRQLAEGATGAQYTYAPSAPVTNQTVTFNGGASTCAATPCTYTYTDVGSDGTGASSGRSAPARP